MLISVIIFTTAKSQGIHLDAYTPIKNIEGNYINLVVFDSLMDSGKHTMRTVVNKDKTLKNIHLQQKTAADSTFEKMVNPGLEKKDNTAPDFNVKSITGTEYVLKELAEKIIVLHFWNTQFKQSISSTTIMNQIFDSYKNNH
ncbi:peroxiredoxin family protein [Aquimarina agarivorans]|uniref:peroxiredoxin family protein n=1 Tax=Aquimarina agarivorans TaxID=980584 RepID=UPI001EE6548B|nr:peroxiredoxin family protein [Aquimarina agarivorans]